MKKHYLLIPFLAFFSFGAIAQDDVEDITMDIKKHKRSHQMNREIKALVANYMIAQGDITVEELETMKEERKAVREELKALRDSGDEEALKARLAELREARADKKEEFKAYLAENQDLATAIKERKEELREERRQQREERKKRREERLEE